MSNVMPHNGSLATIKYHMSHDTVHWVNDERQVSYMGLQAAADFKDSVAHENSHLKLLLMLS